MIVKIYENGKVTVIERKFDYQNVDKFNKYPAIDKSERGTKCDRHQPPALSRERRGRLLHPYHNLAGVFMYLGSPNGGAFKIPLANPGSAKDQQVTDRYGKLVSDQGRAFAGLLKASDRSKLDKTSLYVSKIDKDTFRQYTQVTAEAIGALGSTVYTETLA